SRPQGARGRRTRPGDQGGRRAGPGRARGRAPGRAGRAGGEGRSPGGPAGDIDREAQEDPHRRAPRGAGVVPARSRRGGMTGARRARRAPGGPADGAEARSRGNSAELVETPPLRKGRLTMRSRFVLVAIAMALVAAMVGWSIAATPKQYQFTGNIV